MLPQPAPVTGDAPGAPLSRSDQVRQAARARNTQRAYLGHWTRFHSWAQEQGLDLPGGLEAALCDYLVRLAEDGKRMATIRQARAAIIRGADLAGWPRPGGSGVAEMMRGLGRILRGPQRQAAPLHAEASVMRDGLLRVSEAAALRWGDVELAGDGSGRIRIPESKTDQEAEGVVLYLGPAAALALLTIRPEEAVIDAVTPVFNLHPDTIRRRLQQAARAAWAPRLAGHHRTLWAGGDGPGPVGCGVRPPRADDGGTVEVTPDAGPLHRAPSSRMGCGGQVLPGRQGVEARRRSPGKRVPARESPFSVAVHGRPREIGKAATRLCRGVVRRPPGWCYALCTPLFLAGRSPLQRGDENDGNVDPNLAQDQGHEEQGRVRHQGRRGHPRASTSTRTLWATFHRTRSRLSYSHSESRAAFLAGEPRLGTRAEASRR